MHSVRLDEAQRNLPELVNRLDNGESIIVITRDDQAVALLTSARGPQHSLRSISPSSVGEVLRPLSPDDDLLEEMREE